MKFKEGDRIISDKPFANVVKGRIIGVGKSHYRIEWQLTSSGTSYLHYIPFIDRDYILDEAEDKSTWTIREWLDAGYELRNGDVTVFKHADGTYIEISNIKPSLYWIRGEAFLQDIPDRATISRMFKNRPTIPDPLPCSCSSRDLLICGCKCGGI